MIRVIFAALEAFPGRLAACFAEFPQSMRHWRPPSWEGSEDQMQRSALFEGRPTTLRGLLHFLFSHDNQHLAGMHWLLARMQDKQSA